jgi:hypothetical protein
MESIVSPASARESGRMGTETPEDTRLTMQQTKGLLDLIAAAPELARTVIETLSSPPPTTPGGLALVSSPETGQVGASDPQSAGKRQWLEAALAAAGVRR